MKRVRSELKPELRARSSVLCSSSVSTANLKGVYLSPWKLTVLLPPPLSSEARGGAGRG